MLGRNFSYAFAFNYKGFLPTLPLYILKKLMYNISNNYREVKMNRKSVIILSSLLVCFLILLTCGLAFTSVTPSKERVTDKYIKAGYTHAFFDFGDYSIRTYTKGDESVLIIWYSDKRLADKSIYTANKFKGKRFVVKRGNAIAIGYEDDIKIFQFA